MQDESFGCKITNNCDLENVVVTGLALNFRMQKKFLQVLRTKFPLRPAQFYYFLSCKRWLD